MTHLSTSNTLINAITQQLTSQLPQRIRRAPDMIDGKNDFLLLLLSLFPSLPLSSLPVSPPKLSFPS